MQFPDVIEYYFSTIFFLKLTYFSLVFSFKMLLIMVDTVNSLVNAYKYYRYKSRNKCRKLCKSTNLFCEVKLFNQKKGTTHSGDNIWCSYYGNNYLARKVRYRLGIFYMYCNYVNFINTVTPCRENLFYATHVLVTYCNVFKQFEKSAFFMIESTV